MSAADATPPAAAVATMAVTIRDGEGRPFAYLVRPAEPLGDLLAFALTKEGDGGPTYRVARDRRGRWRCACDGFLWRGRCKHVKKLRELFDLPEDKMATKSKINEAQPQQSLREALRQPFDVDEVKWKPQTVAKGSGRALAVAFIDARAVMDRLDDVLGPLGWQDDYEIHADGTVTCRLSVKDGGEWVTKQDVGGESEQPDPHDKRKAAFSDALKRAGIRWGIGRYLYHLPKQWCDYDEKRRAFVRTPTLPDWAKPGSKSPPPPPPPEPPAPEDPPQPTATVIVGGQHVAGPKPTATVPPAADAGHEQNGTQQQQAAAAKPADPDREKLEADDARLAAEGLSKAGELLAHVREKMRAEGWTWAANKAEAQKAAAVFEWRRLYDRVQRLMDAVKWDWPDLLGQLGMPEETTQLNATQLRGGIKALEAAKAEAELTQRLRT